MKKLFVLLLFLSINLIGQNDSINKLHVGLELSHSITNMYGNVYFSESVRKPGYTLGLNLQYDLSKFLSIRSGLIYELKGNKYSLYYRDENNNVIVDNNGYTDRYDVVYNYNYITLPLLIKFTTPGTNKIFFNTGPYFSYLINSNSKNFINGEEYYYNTTNMGSLFDIGLSIGLGGWFKINDNIKISTEIRDNIGLYNINGNSEYPLKHNTVNFVLCLLYTINKI